MTTSRILVSRNKREGRYTPEAVWYEKSKESAQVYTYRLRFPWIRRGYTRESRKMTKMLVRGGFKEWPLGWEGESYD